MNENMNEQTNKRSRKPQINIPVSAEFLTELRAVCAKTQKRMSDITREALTEKLVEIKRSHPAYQLMPEHSALSGEK
jgi:predicted nucleic acid-binding protein